MTENRLLIAGYLIGAAFTVRQIIWYSAKAWPNLEWGGENTIMAIMLSAVWPVTLPLFQISIWSLGRAPKRRLGFFGRLHARYQGKPND